MDIRRSLEILELGPEPSTDEARQAYKDLVNIWHPDRFSQNPRLKDKAEKKLKEINAAYEEVKAFLSSRQGHDPRTGAAAEDQAPFEAGERDRAEFIAETGTFLLLSAWSHVSGALRRLLMERPEAAPHARPSREADGPHRRRRQGPPNSPGAGGGRGPGRGRGMGRGRGGGGEPGGRG